MNLIFPIGSALLAAFSLVLTEISIGYFKVDPLLVIVLGNVIGGGILLLMSAGNSAGFRRLWQKRTLATVALGALCIYAASYLLFFNAIAMIGAGKAALFGQLETVFVVIFAIIFLGEVLTRRRWIAGLLAFSGMILINFDLQSLQFTLGRGEVLATLSPICVAAGIVVLKPVLDYADARQVTGLALIFGALYMLPFIPFWVTLYVFTTAAFMTIGFMGFCRGTSWLAYNLSLQRIGASQSAIIFVSFAFFTVLLQGLAAWLVPWLEVKLPTNLVAALLGGSLIACGIFVLQTDPARRGAAHSSPAEERATI